MWPRRGEVVQRRVGGPQPREEPVRQPDHSEVSAPPQRQVLTLRRERAPPTYAAPLRTRPLRVWWHRQPRPGQTQSNEPRQAACILAFGPGPARTWYAAIDLTVAFFLFKRGK